MRVLTAIPNIPAKSLLFKQSFKHLLINEIRSFLTYNDIYSPLCFWKTHSNQHAIDLYFSHQKIAILIHPSAMICETHAKSMFELQTITSVDRALIVSQDTYPRRLKNNIEVMPWKHFCEALWRRTILD